MDSTTTSSKTTDDGSGSKTADTTTSSTGGSATPQHGDIKVENGKEYGWFEGFGWVERGGPNGLDIVE